MLKKGDPTHIQGFILYKLWCEHCWATRRGKHHKSIDLENDLHTNYDKRFKGEILKQAEELDAYGLVHIFKSEKRNAICAVLSEDAFRVALPTVNAYLKAIGEEPLEGTIREIITGKRSEKKSPLTQDELRKYARMHRQAQNL